MEDDLAVLLKGLKVEQGRIFIEVLRENCSGFTQTFIIKNVYTVDVTVSITTSGKSKAGFVPVRENVSSEAKRV